MPLFRLKNKYVFSVTKLNVSKGLYSHCTASEIAEKYTTDDRANMSYGGYFMKKRAWNHLIRNELSKLNLEGIQGHGHITMAFGPNIDAYLAAKCPENAYAKISSILISEDGNLACLVVDDLVSEDGIPITSFNKPNPKRGVNKIILHVTVWCRNGRKPFESNLELNKYFK